MNESIRSDYRVFFNELEKSHPGIKYNCFNAVNKLSKIIKNSKQNVKIKKNCSKCGNLCNGEVCSVCKTIFLLET